MVAEIEKEKTVFIGIHLPEDLHTQLKRIAKTEHRRLGMQGAYIIEQYVNKKLQGVEV